MLHSIIISHVHPLTHRLLVFTSSDQKVAQSYLNWHFVGKQLSTAIFDVNKRIPKFQNYSNRHSHFLACYQIQLDGSGRARKTTRPCRESSFKFMFEKNRNTTIWNLSPTHSMRFRPNQQQTFHTTPETTAITTSTCKIISC